MSVQTYNAAMTKRITALFAATLVLPSPLMSDPAKGEGETTDAKPSIVDPATLAVPEQQSRAWSEELRGLLTQQLDLLAGVKDSSSAQAVLAPLKACLAEMEAMKSRVNEEALWIYIENTPDAKQPFIELLLRTSAEFLRLRSEHFFGCRALREALMPQMVMPKSASSTHTVHKDTPR